MATHSSILAWEIPWIEEPDGLRSMVSQRVRHDRSNLACMHGIGDSNDNHMWLSENTATMAPRTESRFWSLRLPKSAEKSVPSRSVRTSLTDESCGLPLRSVSGCKIPKCATLALSENMWTIQHLLNNFHSYFNLAELVSFISIPKPWLLLRVVPGEIAGNRPSEK